MARQTAVEWLEKELKDRHSLMNSDPLFEQAKAMERQQVINAHLTGLIHPLEMEATKQGEQYYNETFKPE